MDWNVPGYCGLSDPVLEIAIDDFLAPVTRLPPEVLARRRGQRIRVHALLGVVVPLADTLYPYARRAKPL